MNELIQANQTNTQVVSCVVSDSFKTELDFGSEVSELLINEREQEAVAVNFHAGLYEISAEIIWRRTIDVLRNRLRCFGDEFIGDMLGYDKPVSAYDISEKETIELNNDIGFFQRANAMMELLHCSEQIRLYTSRDYQMVERINLNKTQAMGIIHNCVDFVLSDKTETTMVSINDIRKVISSELLTEETAFLDNLKTAAYFYKRTILRSLMNLVKTDKENEKQCIFHNMRVIIPLIWGELTEKDKYSFGTRYAEIADSDKKEYKNVVKTVLIQVHGFDYVPENLRSNTFIGAAKHLLSIHNDYNNFYNEPLAASMLASMGTMIPDPAVYDCLNAVLICLTGNGYGVSSDAVKHLRKILDGVSSQKWALYLKDLSKNSELLYQLACVENASKYWVDIAKERHLSEHAFVNEWINRFLGISVEGDYSEVKSMACFQLQKLRGNKFQW